MAEKLVSRICVQKFNDLNGNGKRDPGEPTLSGWIFTVKDGSGREVGQITNEGCIDVPPGTYLVEEQVQPGWTPTTPNPQKVSVGANQTVNVLFGNRQAAEERCCQFGLMLFNTLANTVKKVVLIPANQQAIVGVFNDETPDYTLTVVGTQYVIEPAASPTNPGGFFPTDAQAVLDLDFAIQVHPAMSPTTVTVRWLNASGQVLKEELLKLECQGKVGEEDVDYDWYSMRSTVSGADDTILFSGAEPEECEDFDGEELASLCQQGAAQIQCISNQTILTVPALNVSSTNTYSWQVNDNDVLSNYSGPTLAYPLKPGSHAITTLLTVTAPNVAAGDACSQDLNYCIPDPTFSISTPQLMCSGLFKDKYQVVFTLLDADGCANQIAGYTWDFGDGPPTSNSASPVTHYYGGSGPYTASLKITGTQGDCSTFTKAIPAFNKECDPHFHIEYELCEGTPPGPIKLTFVNDSQTFCNPAFTWSFGNGSQPVIVSGAAATATQTQIYQYNGASTPPQSVSLTMKDDPCASSPVTFKVPFTLKPVQLNLKVPVCPDGEAHFIAQTSGKLIWKKLNGSFPPFGSWLLTRCKLKMAFVNAINALLGQHNGFKCRLDDGTYSISATAEDDSQPNVTATCSRDFDFKVARTCCDDFKAKSYRPLTQNNKDYRLKFKHKVANATFWPGTRIVGKSKFKAKKTVKHTSLSYYKAIRAATISVNITDNLRSGGALPTDPSVICTSCVAPTLFQNGDQRTNSSKAKYKTSVSKRGADKTDDLVSLHYVEHKDGWQWTVKVEKPSGNDCNNYVISCQYPGSPQFVLC